MPGFQTISQIVDASFAIRKVSETEHIRVDIDFFQRTDASFAIGKSTNQNAPALFWRVKSVFKSVYRSNNVSRS